MRNQNQQQPTASNRRLAEALARALLLQRTQDATAVNAALEKNPKPEQQIRDELFVEPRPSTKHHPTPYNPSPFWPYSLNHMNLPIAPLLPNYVDGAFTPPLTPPSEKFGKQPYYQPPLPMYPDGADYNPSLFSPYSSAYTRLPFAPLLPNHVDSALALPATPPSGRFEKRQLQFIHPDLFAPDYRPRFIHPMWPDEYDPVVDDKDLFSDDERWKQPFEKR